MFPSEDYASSRGFEASLVKRFSHKFSGEINYTYSIATGVASDPNQGLQFANGNKSITIPQLDMTWDAGALTLSGTGVDHNGPDWRLPFGHKHGKGQVMAIINLLPPTP